MPAVTRLIHALGAALFIGCALVQHNDPDPLRWIAVYGLAALACGIGAAGRRPRWLILGVLGLAGLWGAVLAAPVLSGVEAPTGEVGREAGGLILVAGWMAALLRTVPVPAPPAAPSRALRSARHRAK